MNGVKAGFVTIVPVISGIVLLGTIFIVIELCSDSQSLAFSRGGEPTLVEEVDRTDRNKISLKNSTAG